MNTEILMSYAKRELVKYGIVGGLSLLCAYIVKYTVVATFITFMTPHQLSSLFLIQTLMAMVKYSLVLLDVNLTDYVEVDVESVTAIENSYGEVTTYDNKTYYFDASQEMYRHLQPNQLSMVVTRRCRLPVMLNIK